MAPGTLSGQECPTDTCVVGNRHAEGSCPKLVGEGWKVGAADCVGGGGCVTQGLREIRGSGSSLIIILLLHLLHIICLNNRRGRQATLADFLET